MAWEFSALVPGEFQRFESPTAGQLLAYPELSQELIQRNRPNWIYRKYVNKVTDFSKGKHEYILFDRMISDYSERWTKSATEFSAVPNVKTEWKRFSIKVDEYTVGIPMTERLQLMARFDINSIVRTYLSDIIRNSIDAQLCFDSMLYSDILAKKMDTGLSFVEGESIRPTKTFASESGYPVTITQNTLGTGETSASITITDILKVKAEMIKRRMIQHSAAVIINTSFLISVFSDTLFFQLVAFSRPERAERGEVGSLMGFEFIVDDTGFLDTALTNNVDNWNGNTQYNSIALFLATDGHREAIALPENVRQDVPLELGRYSRIGAVSYRGESPLWFTADPDNKTPKQGAGIVLVGA